MNSMSILKGLNDIDDRYIESAAPDMSVGEKRKIIPFYLHHMFTGFATVAAVFVIAFIAINRPSINNNVPGEFASSPIVECASIEEAEEITGIQFSVPDEYGNSKTKVITVIGGEIIDVSYLDENEECILSIRKGHKTENISGDYSEYVYVNTVSHGDICVTVKGDLDRLYLGEWDNNDFSYSISSTSGLTQDEMLRLVMMISD